MVLSVLGDGRGTGVLKALVGPDLVQLYMANVVVLGVLSNPSDGSRTRRVVEVLVLADFGGGSRSGS